MQSFIPNYAYHILSILNKNGFDAYLVGGCVRDAVMGKKPNDWDITTSAYPKETEKLFSRTVPTGIKYGTVTVLYGKGKAEVTTFRTEGKYTGNRKPEKVSFVSDLREDLIRRDFTMNAMAMDKEGNITDLFGGKEDIEHKLIRCVGNPDERFNEDALRMLRAMRFSAQLGFEIEEKTLSAIRRNAHLASSLSGERVREETEKMLLSPAPEKLFEAIKMGLYEKHFTKEVRPLQNLRKLPKDRLVRWTALCAATGVKKIPATLKADGKTASVVKKALELFEAGLPKTEGELRYLAGVYGAETVRCAAAAENLKKYRSVSKALKNGKIIGLSDLKISGDDLAKLGIQPGPEMGRMIDCFLCIVNRDPKKNEKSVLVNMVKELMER